MRRFGLLFIGLFVVGCSSSDEMPTPDGPPPPEVQHHRNETGNRGSAATHAPNPKGG